VMKAPQKRNIMARGRTFLDNFILQSYVDKASQCQFNCSFSWQDRLFFSVKFSARLLIPIPPTLFLFRLDEIFPMLEPEEGKGNGKSWVEYAIINGIF